MENKYVISSDLREAYIAGEIFNIGETVNVSGSLEEIVHRGANYLMTIDENYKIQRRWLTECIETEYGFKIWEPSGISEEIVNAFAASMDSGVERVVLARAISELMTNGVTETYVDIIAENSLVEIHSYLLEMDDEIKEYLTAKMLKLESKYEKKGSKKSECHKEEADYDFETASDDEIDDVIKSHLSDDDYWDAYEDEELSVVDSDTGEAIEEETQLNEVLSRVERIKSRIRFARTQGKRERKLQIALKRKSSQQVLSGRARKLAVKAIKARLARKNLDKLSVPEKERIEARIAKMGKVISRVAVRLMPRVKELEKSRLHHDKYTKE